MKIGTIVLNHSAGDGNPSNIADCEYCPLGWEIRGYEGECYDCGCMVDEDINWCKKTYKERLEKAKEFDKDKEY